jgi:AcrR family transcriptional regulator
MSTDRQPLSRAAIVAAAITVIDRDGLERLSMRRLGNELGYEAMALYKHVADKAALLDAVIEAAYAEMTPPDPSDPWDDRIRHAARELRRVALRHPELLIAMITSPPACPAVHTRIDGILEALDESGLGADDVVRSFRLFVNLTSGALLSETTAVRQQTGPLDNQVAVDECRALAEFGAALASCDFDVEFDDTVETFIRLSQLNGSTTRRPA